MVLPDFQTAHTQTHTCTASCMRLNVCVPSSLLSLHLAECQLVCVGIKDKGGHRESQRVWGGKATEWQQGGRKMESKRRTAQWIDRKCKWGTTGKCNDRKWTENLGYTEKIFPSDSTYFFITVKILKKLFKLCIHSMKIEIEVHKTGQNLCFLIFPSSFEPSYLVCRRAEKKMISNYLRNCKNIYYHYFFYYQFWPLFSWNIS